MASDRPPAAAAAAAAAADPPVAASAESSSASPSTPFSTWSAHCLDPTGVDLPGGVGGEGGGDGDNEAQQPRRDLRTVSSEYFSSLSGSSGGSSSNSPSHELSTLISSLDPALGPTQKRIPPRVRALRLLGGAIEGCCGGSGSGGSGVGLTYAVRELVGKFLVEHCRPVEPNYEEIDGDADDDDGDGEGGDNDGEGAEIGEAVRDAAAHAMVALLGCPLDLGAIGELPPPSSSNGDDAADAAAAASAAAAVGRAVSESIRLRLTLAQRAVGRRCESDDLETDYEHGYERGYGGGGGNDDAAALTTIEGLSTLSRAKRSLCFTVLGGAVDGVESDVRTLSSLDDDASREEADASTSAGALAAARGGASKFATFVATCLHGETDPRCLLQMLQLIQRVQIVLDPIFETVGGCAGASKAASDDDGAVDKMDTTAADDNAANDAMETTTTGGADNPDHQTANNAPAPQPQPQAVPFPTVDVFDAVAPYYPIKFTPPPNDPHKITREGLHDALMGVLRREVGRARVSKGDSGGSAGEGAGAGEGEGKEEGLETMTELASRLFLERLIPPPSSDPYGDYEDEDNQPSVGDKIDALADLGGLLVPEAGGGRDDPLGRCSVGVALIRELSSALIRTHDGAVAEIATAAAEERDLLAELIDKCRGLAARAAHRLERQPRPEEQLWDAFVLDTVRDLSAILATSPQSMRGRSATAYLASLAGSGGVRTLRTCLGGCLPPLLSALRANDGSSSPSATIDEEKAAAAALGVGLFFSSSERTITEAERGGVVVHPHPLRDYGPEAVLALCSLAGGGGGSSSRRQVGIALKVAAVKGLGSVLLATPSSILSDVAIDAVRTELEYLAGVISCGTTISKSDEGVGGGGDDEWRGACSTVVGSALGRALMRRTKDGVVDDDLMQTEDDDVVGAAPCKATCVLDDDEGSITFIADTLFSRLVESATTAASPAGASDGAEDGDEERKKRFDWIALAHACQVGQEKSSYYVVSELVKAIVQRLKETSSTSPDPGHDCSHPAIIPARALSCVIQKGGKFPTDVFHNLSPPDDTPFDILQEFCGPFVQRGGMRGVPNDMGKSQQAVGMSALMLPSEKAQNRADAKRSIDLAYLILTQILPAYRTSVPPSQRDRFIKSVSQVLPPLSEWDNSRLCAMMPILAAILGSDEARLDAAALDDTTIESLEGMARCLVEYALCSDWDPRARSAAASCLFFIILYYQRDNTQCLAFLTLRDSILPSAVNASKQLMESQKGDCRIKSILGFENALNLSALVGSAAACRGGPSSQTADQVTRFVVKLACNGSAPVPWSNETVAICGDDSSDGAFHCEQRGLQILAASSLGSMLSVQNGGPFWRQRMIHIAVADVLSAFESKATSSTSPSPPLGALAATCHIACCAPNLAIGEQRVKELADIVARGLVECANMSDEDKKVLGGWNSLLSVILAALVKFISSAPDAMTPYAAGLVSTFLLLCTTSNAIEDAPYQLLALQCMEAVTHLPSARRACKALKPTVVSNLAEMADHPSIVVRQAAIKVRNVWCILE